MQETKQLSYPKLKKEFCVGITEENELIFINCEFGSCDNDHYTITHDSYEGLIDEETGENNARDILSNSDYWDDLGMIDNKSFLTDFIDFGAVAERVLNTDGWENTNGEYQRIGNYEGTDYYINFSSCGASIDDLKKDFKKLLITEEEKQLLIESDKLHLKDVKSYTEEDTELFKKVWDFIQKIESNGLEDQEGLIPLLLGVE